MVLQNNSSFDEDSKAVIIDSRWNGDQLTQYILKFLAHLKPYLMDEQKADFVFVRKVGDSLEALPKNQVVDGRTLDSIVTMNRKSTLTWRKQTVYIGMSLSCYRSDI